jgi:hypothetical protein
MRVRVHEYSTPLVSVHLVYDKLGVAGSRLQVCDDMTIRAILLCCSIGVQRSISVQTCFDVIKTLHMNCSDSNIGIEFGEDSQNPLPISVAN